MKTEISKIQSYYVLLLMHYVLHRRMLYHRFGWLVSVGSCKYAAFGSNLRRNNRVTWPSTCWFVYTIHSINVSRVHSFSVYRSQVNQVFNHLKKLSWHQVLETLYKKCGTRYWVHYVSSVRLSNYVSFFYVDKKVVLFQTSCNYIHFSCWHY